MKAVTVRGSRATSRRSSSSCRRSKRRVASGRRCSHCTRCGRVPLLRRPSYRLKRAGCSTSSGQMIEHIGAIVARYPITSIEDAPCRGGLGWFKSLPAGSGNRCKSSATTCSRPIQRVQSTALNMQAANAVLVKPESDRHARPRLSVRLTSRVGRASATSFSAQRRNRGHDHCRSGSWHGGQIHQDRLHRPQRAAGKVQSAAAH